MRFTAVGRRLSKLASIVAHSLTMLLVDKAVSYILGQPDGQQSPSTVWKDRLLTNMIAH